MRISFTCTTNKPYTRINTAVFTLKNGTTVTVDRDESDFLNEPSEEAGNPRELTMDWVGCYIWAINDCNIFGSNGFHLYDVDAIEEFKSLVQDAAVSFELEDDAPDDDDTDIPYEVNIKGYSIS